MNLWQKKPFTGFARALFLKAAVQHPEDVYNTGASGHMAWALKAAVQAPDDVHPPWGSSNAVIHL